MSALDITSLIMVFVFAGAATGLLAGLLGIGGGIVTVPVLFQVFVFMELDPSLQMHCAVGSSLAVIMITAIRAGFAHYDKGVVDMVLVRRWGPMIVLGTVIGAASVRFLNPSILQFVFGMLSLFLAIWLSFFNIARPHASLPHPFIQRGLATLIGYFASIMGIGGGMMLNIVQVLSGRSIHQSVGTSSALGFFVALPGTLGFMVAGYGLAGLPAFSIGYVNLLAVACLVPSAAVAAPLGAKLAHHFSRKQLERIFCVFLVIATVRMFWSLFVG